MIFSIPVRFGISKKKINVFGSFKNERSRVPVPVPEKPKNISFGFYKNDNSGSGSINSAYLSLLTRILI